MFHRLCADLAPFLLLIAVALSRVVKKGSRRKQRVANFIPSFDAIAVGSKSKARTAGVFWNKMGIVEISLFIPLTQCLSLH
jgi:hypothetical protein